MSAPPTTQRIQPSEWEAHKGRILELYLDKNHKLLGDGGVIETMKNEGFTATKSQYETQLRAWNVRKYMTSKEWTRIIPIIQKDRERGSTNELRPLGRVMKPSRIERACRRYASRASQAIEGESRDDDRLLSISTESRHSFVESAVPEIVDMSLIEPFEEVIDLSTLGNPDPFIFEAADPSIDDDLAGSTFQAWGTDGISFETNLSSNNHDGLGSALECLIEQANGAIEMDHTQSLAPSQLHITDLSFGTTAAPVASGFPPCPFVSNTTVTTQQKQVVLPRNSWIGALTSSEITEMVLNSVSSASLLNPAYHSLSSTRSYRMIGQFIADVNESISLRRRQPAIDTIPSQVYASLFSEETLVGEEQDIFAMLSSDDAFEYRLYSRLIKSMINGYAGLKEIPASAILKFLNRHHGMQSTLFQFLRSSSECVAKALAESTFQAAIEADDANVVKLLINLHLVDAEKACKPFKKAALNQSYGVLRLFLDLGIDINKSSMLEHLVGGQNPQSTLDEEFLHLVDSCFEAGAAIKLDLMDRVLERFVDPRLARSLIPKFVSQTSLEFILGTCTKHLSQIVRYLDEEDALSMTKLAMDACQKIGDRKTRQHLLRVFLVAIEERKQGLINIFLEERHLDLIRSGPAFTAALKSGNQPLVRFLEEIGALSCFETDWDFDEAVTTALEMKNLGYAYKLLHDHPIEHRSGLYNSLAFAVANAYDDFVEALLGAGARIIGINDPIKPYGRPVQPLIVAIKKGKAQIVRAMLDHNHLPPACTNGNRYLSLALEAALECSDGTMLHDILKSLSSVHYLVCDITTFELSFRKGGLDLFREILRLGCQEPKSLSNALKFAVELEDVSLLHELFHLGARSDDDRALRKAVKTRPSMIGPLLKRFREAYPRGRSGYGIDAMISAVAGFPACREGLDILLASKVTNVDTPQHFYTKWKGLRRKGGRSPLGKAINRHGSEVTRGNIELVRKLLDAGGDPNSITTMSSEFGLGQTAFLDAIQTGSIAMVELLLQYGARVNEPAHCGLIRTPLQKAVEVDSLDIVRLLLERDADVNAAPAMRDGATALQLAAINGNCTIATILIERGARLDLAPPLGPYGRWPLEGAAEHDRLDMIQLIWYANKRQLDHEQCQKAMRLAERNGHIGCRDLVAELMSGRPAISWGFQGDKSLDLDVNFDSR